MRPDQPVGRFDYKTRLWLLLEPWSVELSQGKRLLVNPGFLSDGASVPRVLWPVVGPKMAWNFPAALAHDAMYASELVGRAQADREFRRLLTLCGVGWTQTQLYYHAVRVAGWIPWRRHTASTITDARRVVSLRDAGWMP